MRMDLRIKQDWRQDNQLYCYQGGTGKTEGLRCITAVKVKQENIIGCKKKKAEL